MVRRRWRFYVTADGRKVVDEELDTLGVEAEAVVSDAMRRAKRNELFTYEQETISREIRAIRVFFDKNTYRVLYAHEGKHDQIFLALHAMQKKDRKLPDRARRKAEKRLADWRQRGR